MRNANNFLQDLNSCHRGHFLYIYIYIYIAPETALSLYIYIYIYIYGGVPEFLLGSGRVDTAVWMLHLDANKTAGEEARR